MESILDDRLALALNIDRLMRRIHVDLRPGAEAVDAFRVGPLGGMILMTIAETEPVPTQILAREVGRDSGQMTRILNMLERKGLLTRARSTEDGRVWLVSLTETGQTQVSKFQAALLEVVDGLLHKLDPEERSQLSRALEKVLGGESQLPPNETSLGGASPSARLT